MKQINKLNAVRFLIAAALGTTTATITTSILKEDWRMVTVVALPFLLMIAAYIVASKIDIWAIRKDAADEVFEIIRASMKGNKSDS